MSVTAPSVLNGNILSKTDSDFESGTPTWVAGTNSNAVSVTSSYSFSGAKSLTWTGNGSGDSYINTGYYSCKPAQGYTFSVNVNCVSYLHDLYVGVAWYNSSHVQIGSTVYGNDMPNTAIDVFRSVVLAATSPAGAAYFKVNVWVGTNVQSGEQFCIDLCYATQTQCQVLIDWVNPAFITSSVAGNDFTDMTPWVRWDDNVTMNRGRQDAISEIQSGQATFSIQNDGGWFTPQLSTSPYYPNVSLGRRVQINVTDAYGNWYTRFDGSITEVTYSVDVTGGTNLANYSCSDVLAYLNRQDAMSCWTLETVKNDGPWLMWPLNDAGDTQLCAEMSGNNGPPLRLTDYVTGSSAATVTWRNSNGGVETLSDAATAIALDGSEYWTPGSDVPATPLRGLDSGVVGPVSSTLSSVYLKPVLTTEAGQNYFAGTDGYQLQAELYLNGQPYPINPNVAGNNYTIECWFVPDPSLSTSTMINKDYGPFTALSLGSGRSSACLVAGIFYNSSAYTFQVATYTQPPAFAELAYGVVESQLATIAGTWTADTVARPHHLALQIVGASGGGALNIYIDGVLFGTYSPLPSGWVFDTICLGGSYGGHGNFYGNLSIASIYQYALTQNQIINHASVGQYGMWEQTTDNCIGALSSFADLPTFWNGLALGQNLGLTLTDYYDITGNTPLSNMQVYEQAERGLLFVNSSGQLIFHTRDWRMGYGAPDVALQASIYNADLGYEMIDTYLLNEAATNTSVFSTGVDWQNSSSYQNYGPYSNGTQTSPVTLPLITWSRGYSVLGLSQYGYWTNPNLDDNSAWQINTRNTPRLVCGQLTIDMLTFETADAGGYTTTSIMNLDIDNMVTLAGLPASFPDQAGALDYFIEGVNETVGCDTHTITFYTSPASVQRAWKMGDSTYGILGSTTRIGISAPDVSTPPALGKTVAHDGGPPFWPPTYTTGFSAYQLGFYNGSTQNPQITPNYGSGNGSISGDAILVTVESPSTATITVTDTQSNTYNTIGGAVSNGSNYQYAFVAFNTVGLNAVNDYITISTDASRAYTTAAYDISGVSAIDPNGTTFTTSTGTSTSPSITVPTLTEAGEMELVFFTDASNVTASLPGGGWTQVGYNFYNSTYIDYVWWKQSTSTTGDTCSTTCSSCAWGMMTIAFVPKAFVLNNPANNNHQFVGNTEMRGIRDNLATAINPPLCITGCVNKNVSISSGNNGVQNHCVWDTLYVDTVGGMGIIPGWPNWYCCLVPGFYEIDAAVPWAAHSSGNSSIRTAWIIVAQGAAQMVAAGTGSPYTNATYACPIGDQVYYNNSTISESDTPSTRIYLGVGDMVNIGLMQQSGIAVSTAVGNHGPVMSIRWVGYGTKADQYPTAGAPGGSSHTAPPTSKTTYTKSWNATGTYSYWGTTTIWSPQLRYTNGLVYQGEYSGGGAAGAQFAIITVNQSSISSALSGATVNSCYLKMTNQHSWYDSGVSLQLGMTSDTSFGSSYNPNAGHCLLDCGEFHFNEGQTVNMNIGVWFANELKSGTYKNLIMGNGNTSLSYYGYWTGGTNPVLTITYTK